METTLSPAITPFDAATMIESVDCDGRGLRLIFQRNRDRYSHIIASVENARMTDESVTPILISVEGDDQQTWPPSPPLQSLSIERRISSDVALLVGMAGKSHWSASVEAMEPERRLEFDLACRSSDPSAKLGSRYRWLLPVQRSIASSCLIDCTLGKWQIRVLPELGVAAVRENYLVMDAERAVLKGSTRWKFSIELAST